MEFDPYDDSLNFDVVWGDHTKDYKEGRHEIVMKTANDEEYICQLPEPSPFEGPDYVDVDISARDVVGKLEKDKSCSYRVDSYWIYEVCHGKHVKQFHEERDSSDKTVLVKQAFFLGYIAEDSYLDAEPTEYSNMPTLNHAGALRPYYSVTFTGGTDCDLIEGVKRMTTVYYLCMPDFQTSVVSVKETSTCRYEVIIYTSKLCRNKLYRVKEDPVNHVYCLSSDGTKWRRPIGYEALNEQKVDTLFNVAPTTTPVGKLGGFLSAPKATGSSEKSSSTHPKSVKNAASTEPKKSQLTFSEKNFIRDFLTTETCVIGGVGWWKYDFCYQKSLKQIHQDKKGPRTEVLLGLWDETRHIEHVKEKGLKSKNPNHTDLYYFMGDICDETGLPRQVKVRLRCSEVKSNLQALTMFLEEPSTCVYAFTAESPLFCKLLGDLDDYGIPKSSVDEIIENI